jgi:hypothetical protein
MANFIVYHKNRGERERKRKEKKKSASKVSYVISTLFQMDKLLMK